MPQQKKKKKDQDIIDPFAQKEGQDIIDPFEQKDEIIDPFTEGVFKGALRTTLAQPLVQKTISTISPALDFLARPSYASARFADALAEDSKGVLDAVGEAWTELTGTGAERTKISFSDVIRRRFPEFAIQNPRATTMLGFVGDVALDPTTYLGVGLVKDGIVVGGKVITKTTRQTLEEALKTTSRKVFVAKDGTLELVESLPTITARAEKVEQALTKRVAKAKGEEVLLKPESAAKIVRRVEVERELKSTGYFDAVRQKQDEISKLVEDLNKQTGIPIVNIADTIAKSETLKDLKRAGDSRLEHELLTDEVRERVNQRIIRLTQLNPEAQSKIFEPKGAFLKVGLPFGKQRDIIKIAGLEGISNRVKSIQSYIASSGQFGKFIAETVPRAFNRNFGLPEEYLKFRDELENELGYLTGQIIRQTRKLFKDTDEEGRKRIGESLHWMDDETRRLEQIRAQSTDPNFRTLTDGEAAQIAQQGMEKFKLTDKEKAIFLQIQQTYKEAALLEMRAGLLKSNLVNYTPRGYVLIDDVDDMSLITRGQYGQAVPQPYLASSKQRKLLTLEDAKKQGLVPELDAAVLYAHRVLSSKRALGIKQFRDSVDEMFGTLSTRSKIAHTGILPTAVIGENLPKNIISDMQMIGEAVYPSGMNDGFRSFLTFTDRWQRLWKRGATTIRPTFAPKQLISNTFQAALVTGARAFKALDPRVAVDAAILLMRAGKPLQNVPFFLTNFISKHFTGNNGLDGILANRVVASKILGEEELTNFAKDFRLKSALGQEFSGTELVQLMREHGVIRGFDATGEAFTDRLTRELSRETNSYKNVVKELGKVWNHASMVEDYGRAMLFLNGMRMGYTAKDASKLVNKALFDYGRGLSFIEKNVIKRIIPFYTFQRFAIPFVLKQTLKQPGSAVTLDKLMRTTEKLLLTGEELNDGEVDIFNEEGNNPILEQPRLLSGFDVTGKASLNILNNLTPFDVVNLFTYDREGNIDIPRSMEQVFAAALTPYIKLPFQYLLKRDFFTAKTIEQASVLGDLSGSVGKGFDVLEGMIGKTIPKYAKDLMSWEIRKHAITGKTTTYINPFLSYWSMQFIPALRDIVKPLEQEGQGTWAPSLYGAMNLLLPFKTKQFDFREKGDISRLRRVKEIEELEQSLSTAKIKGSTNEYEQNSAKLKRYLDILGLNSKERAGQNIRGQGITGASQLTTTEGVEIPPLESKEQPLNR